MPRDQEKAGDQVSPGMGLTSANGRDANGLLLGDALSGSHITMLAYDLIEAVLDHRRADERREALAATLSDMDGAAARRVAAALAVLVVQVPVPRRSKRALREWLHMRRFQVEMSGVSVDD